MPSRSVFPANEHSDWLCRNILKELATFCALANADGHLQAAAKRVLKTPRAVGKNIQHLEREFGKWFKDLPLLDHTHPKQSIVPTEAGQAMVRFAADVLSRSEQFLQELERIQNDGEVRVATIYSSWETYGSQLEAEFKTHMPHGSVSVTFFNATGYIRQIETEVREGRADVGITSYPPKDIAPPLTVLPLKAQEMMLVLPATYKHLPKGKGPVSLVDVTLEDPDLKFVIYDRSIDIPANNKVITYLSECGMGLKNNKRLEGLTIKDIKALISPGSFSILPASAVKNEVASGKFRVYSLTPTLEKWPWGIICHPLDYCNGSQFSPA